MAARTSPLKIKQMLANQRENKRLYDPPKHLQATTADANRRQFNDDNTPKFYVPKAVAYRLELEKRAAMLREGLYGALSMREDLIPLHEIDMPLRSPWVRRRDDPTLERFRPLSKRQRAMLARS